MTPSLRQTARALRAAKRAVGREGARLRAERRAARALKRQRRQAAQEAAEALSRDEQDMLSARWEERAELVRRVHRGHRKGAYIFLIGPPPLCDPGDVDTAKGYLYRITAAIERGGWSPSECAALHVLRKRWAHRAGGQDTRFNLAGNKPGRLPRGLEAQIKSEV